MIYYLYFLNDVFSSDHSGEETPVPISNTVVKLSSADGTILVTEWKSRSLLGIKKPHIKMGFFVFS